jgi:hypothetical protein
MTRLFLDCEWADNIGSELVSLALVSEDDRYRFYAELSPLPAHPTPFVRHVIYPSLERGHHARKAAELTRELRMFLTRVPQPHVLYDYPVDGVLFRYALDGFELDDVALAQMPTAPSVESTLIRERDAVRLQMDRYFSAHPDRARRRHHPLADAEALRWAFLQLLGDLPEGGSDGAK